jgi:hypothetical protein
VAAGVRVLGAERRTEAVDVRECERPDLGPELARDGQERGPAEELAVELGRGHAKHRARALRVAGADDRRVQPDEAPLLEEAVNCARGDVAHAQHGAERVRARAQVRDRAQELEAMALLLQRIVGIGKAQDSEPRSAQLECLTLAL